MPYRSAWLAHGAQPFGDLSEIDGSDGQLPATASRSGEDPPPGETLQADEPFASASAALDALGLGGAVPEVLARRIRQQYGAADPEEQ